MIATPTPTPAELIEQLKDIDTPRPLALAAAVQISRDQETIAALVEAIRFAKFANESLEAYEWDLGDQLPDEHEIGRIDDSRNAPSFRIRVGHIRKLVAALRQAGER